VAIFNGRGLTTMSIVNPVIPTTVKAAAAAIAALSWPLMMATEVNPSPLEVAGITAVAMLAVKALADIAMKAFKRPAHPGHADAAGLRDMMLREFSELKKRLDGIDGEVRINRERYHDVANVLGKLTVEMKLLMSGRIKPGHGDD
jgi:hypothetical protein